MSRLRRLTDRPARLLIAEDDDPMRRALGLLFAHEGYEVRSVDDGLTFIRALRPMVLAESDHWAPDLLLVDVGLPRIDGLYVLEALRELHWETPAIILTGLDTPRTRRRVAELPETEFFVKPVEFHRLAGVIRHRARRLGFDV